MRALIFLILLWPFTVQAETNLWLQLGATRSTMTDMEESNEDSELHPVKAPTFGVLAEIPIRKTTGSALFGLSLVHKGMNAAAKDEDIEFSGGFLFRYIQINALGKLAFPFDDDTSGHMTLGAYYGIENKCELSIGFQGAEVNVDCDNEELDIDIKGRNRFGFSTGAGISSKVSKVILSLDVSYDFDVTSISADDEETKHNAFAIKAGVGFPIGKE